VPLGASGEVITASPPNARTAAAISSLSVATITRPAVRDRDAAHPTRQQGRFGGV
jgi:hypothetical protein